MTLPLWLLDRWFPAAVLLLALAFAAAFAYLRQRRPGRALTFGLLGLALGLLALGGLGLSATASVWALSTAGLVFAGMIALLLLSGGWSRSLGLGVAALALVALGGLSLRAAGEGIVEAWQALENMRLKEPWWLALLALVPVFVVLAMRRLNRSEVRPWMSLLLRCVLVALVALALAEPYVAQPTRNLTVLFVVDRSLSIPEDFQPDPADETKTIDRRVVRIVKFINETVEKRGRSHDRDKAGLIVFGRRPRLELPPSDAPRFNLRAMPSAEDGNYTDIAAALKLALASFPEGTGKRIVLVSDGNENLGNAEEQARLARTLGVQIDVLPLAAGQRNEDEVLVERVDAPQEIEEGARVPIRVLVRSFNPNLVFGELTLRQITGPESDVSVPLAADGTLGLEVEPAKAPARGVRITRVPPASPAARARLTTSMTILRVDGRDVNSAASFAAELARFVARAPKGSKQLKVKLNIRHANPTQTIARKMVYLRRGLNSIPFDRPQREEHSSYSYEAEFQPRGVADPNRVDAKGVPVLLRKGLPGDRVQNNRAATHVIARGQGRILLLENERGKHQEAVEALAAAGGGKRFQVDRLIVDEFKGDMTFLSRYDCLILANVPADRLSEAQQEAIRANTGDQGCGLVVIGGPDSYGAGGWQKTPVELAMPVDCDIKSLKVQGKGGLVLIMHASEMADGNRWQKKIAKLAVERLGPGDEVGVIDYSGFKNRWFIPMTEVEPKRAEILAKIDKLTPMDMPDFDPALKLAHAGLMDPAKMFAVKHMIIISDGDPAQNDRGLLRRIKDDKISIATVGVATHGLGLDKSMEDMATIDKTTGKPRRYKVDDPRKLPAIYIKETRLVAQSFVHRKLFKPRMVPSGPVANFNDLPKLLGYVRTTPKPNPLVQVPIWTEKFGEHEFPVLAYWPYGLGKSVAFTSDAGLPERWSASWIASGVFARLWEETVAWSLRPTESGNLRMTAEYRDGKVKVIVEARKDGKPDTALRLRGAITSPSNRGGKQRRLTFVQRNSGVYEAEVKAEEAGSYFVNAQAVRTKKVIGPDGKEKDEDEVADSVRSGVTLPYSPEFAEMETNAALLERLREITEGQAYVDDDDALAEAARSGDVFRRPPDRVKSSLPFYYWLLFLAVGLLFLDIATRRLAFDPNAVLERAETIWARWRGFPAPPPRTVQEGGRLQARRAPIDSEVASRGERRFERPTSGGVPLGADATAPATPATARTAEPGESTAPGQPEGQPGDFADRLLKAKRKVWEERDPNKPSE